jgi:methionyl-tRNA synthetase
MPKYYITTPIYYVNSRPHIGHSYTEIACDAAARFMRQSGREVFFMTGTDEHGEKIGKAALEAGMGPGGEKRFVDSIVPVFKELWEKLGIQYDHFIRTTDDYHVKCVQAFLGRLHEEGKIYRKAYKGWFCTPCETFWSETQSADGACPDCKRPLEKLDETNYFLKMSEHQKWLVDYINSNPGFIKPDFRRNEVLGFLNNEELLDLCISRPKSRMSWGIELPFDRDYVAYVWFDALVNYISGIGYGRDKERFGRLWPADVHVIGKDIIRHHAVFWPIMLRAAGIEPPKTIFAHGWWVIKGEKMSKSKGNAVDPLELIAKYGIDPYRYFLLREVQFGADGSFGEEALVARYNSDLANDLGNLLNRTLTMAGKYFGFKAPQASPQASHGGAELVAKAGELGGVMEAAMPEFDFVTALTKIWDVVKAANKYIEDSKPWTLAKEARTRELAGVIYNLLEALRIASVCVWPFMPGTARNILAQLGIEGDPGLMRVPESARWGLMKAGHQVRQPTPLFPRIETK